MIALFQSQKSWMADQLAEHDLTPLLAHALHAIADGDADGLTMSAFANCVFVDASNATGMVDRLEARGLVERLPSTADRRVKLVHLTAAGKRLHRRLDELQLKDGPPPIESLSAGDLRTLREILERALALADTGA